VAVELGDFLGGDADALQLARGHRIEGFATARKAKRCDSAANTFFTFQPRRRDRTLCRSTKQNQNKGAKQGRYLLDVLSFDAGHGQQATQVRQGQRQDFAHVGDAEKRKLRFFSTHIARSEADGGGAPQHRALVGR